jgi:WD40-like Beta Propeller Repeat
MKPLNRTSGLAVLLAVAAACDRPPDLASSAIRPVPFALPEAFQGPREIWEARYSPDGRRIAFLATWDGETRVATLEDGDTESSTLPGYDVHSFAWLPGSEEILTAHTDPRKHWFSPDELAVWSSDGAFIRGVPVNRSFVVEDGLAVSPDGRYAVAAATPPPGTAGYTPEADLLLIALDLGLVRNLTRTPWFDEHSPEFAGPHRVVFGRESILGRGAVLSLDLGTERLRRLNPPDVDVVDVTAAGDKVLYGSTWKTFGGETTCFWELQLPDRFPTPMFCFRGAAPDLAAGGGSVLLNVDPPEPEWGSYLGGIGRIVEVPL